MQYNYHININATKWGNEILSISLPAEIAAAASYISNISADMGGWYLEGIELVLSGKSDYQERDGEFLGARINRDYTEIYDLFTGKLEICTIETVELKNLIEIWLYEMKNHNS